MARTNWLDTGGDFWLRGLRDLEELPKRGIRGIGGIGSFIVTRIPQLCLRLLAWLEERCIYACKVAIRVLRIAGLALFWLAIVAAPFCVYPGIITGSWVLVALLGSWWGMHHHHMKPLDQLERRKEGFYA